MKVDWYWRQEGVCTVGILFTVSQSTCKANFFDTYQNMACTFQIRPYCTLLLLWRKRSWSSVTLSHHPFTYILSVGTDITLNGGQCPHKTNAPTAFLRLCYISTRLYLDVSFYCCSCCQPLQLWIGCTVIEFVFSRVYCLVRRRLLVRAASGIHIFLAVHLPKSGPWRLLWVQ